MAENNIDAYKQLTFKGKIGNENEIKAGLSKSNIDEESLKSIFEAIDRADENGQKDGVLDNDEVAKFKEQVLKSAKHGKISILSENEANKILKNLGITDKKISSKDLFDLLNLFTEQSKEIISQAKTEAHNLQGQKENALLTKYKNRQEIVFPNGSKITIESKTDKNGNKVQIIKQYDKNNHLRKIIQRYEHVTVTEEYTYDGDKVKQAVTKVCDQSGKVIQTQTTSFEYNEEGKVVSKKTVKETSNKQKTEIYETVEYNEQGKISKKIIKQVGPDTWKNPLTKKVEPKIKETTIEYEYDDNGKLLKSTKKEGKLKTTVSEFNSDGKLVKQTTTNTKLHISKKDGKTNITVGKSTAVSEFEYDENGNKVSCTIKSTDDFGRPAEVYIQYAEDGKTIKTKSETYYKRGGKVQDFYDGVNIENRVGIPSTRIEYEDDGVTIKRKTVNIFDDDGILIGRKIYDKDNNLIAEHDFSTVNGEFDVSNQIARGDCYFLATINSLSQTDTGHQILKDNLKIETDSNGKKVYKISFPGAKELRNKLKNGTAANGLAAIPENKIYIQDTYTITEDELRNAAKKAGSKYSAGDKDVLLMEVAYEKFRKDAYRTRTENKIPDQIQPPGLGAFSAKNIKKGDFLSSGKPSDASYLITGNVSSTYCADANQNVPIVYVDADYQMHITDENGQILDNSKDDVTIPPQMQAMLDALEKDSEDGKIDDFAAMACFKVAQQEVNGQVTKGGGHALTITKVDKDNVYLANPWYPEQEIVMSKKDFAKSCYRLDTTAMNKNAQNELPTNNDNSNNVQPPKIVPNTNNKPNYTVPKGKGYTTLIKEKLLEQGFKVTPENIKKARAQFESANPKGTVRTYENGKRKDWIGNQYLLAGAKVYIPQFTDME